MLLEEVQSRAISLPLSRRVYAIETAEVGSGKGAPALGSV